MSLLLYLLLLPLLSISAYVLYHYLFALPTVSPQADRAALTNKVVWITGASAGIGKALAEYLVSQRVKVVLSARNTTSLESVASTLRSSGVTDVLVLPLDVAALTPPLAEAAVQQVEAQFGAVDVLIHNAGMSMRGDVLSTHMSVDQQLMALNYFGAVALTKAVLPGMVARRRGQLVAVSSVQGKLPIACRSSYAASKHAMEAFFNSLRYEVAPFNIGVTILSLGYVQTNLSLNALAADGSKYGQMDATQLQGYPPSYIAALTYASIRQNLPDVVVADAKARVALLLQAVCPPLLRLVLSKKAEKERRSSKQKQ